jgi:3',5'-cyclic AMP phosphodiesterase CpdA
MAMRSISFASLLILMAQSSAAPVPLPNQTNSFKFVVLGDSGTGEQPQYELADQMAALRERFKYDVVLLLGGNVYGSERPSDFVKKFEAPYKRLLEGGVIFHAAIGNEDSREQQYYKNFNMNGNTHYTFEPRSDVQFLALDSTYFTKEQIDWLEATLKQSKAAWKIVYLHHPLYSSGRRHGSSSALRRLLEPLLVKYNVTVVFSAHDNVYERTKPQNDITYFVVGSGGKLRQGDIDRNTGLTASGFDTDLAFVAAETTGDQMYFNAISRTGQTVDSGVLARRK